MQDAPMGPKVPYSTVLTPEEEAACVAFRQHTLLPLPLDDCLYRIDIAEVRTEEGKLYLFVAIDRTSKFAYAEREIVTAFLKNLVASVFRLTLTGSASPFLTKVGSIV